MGRSRGDVHTAHRLPIHGGGFCDGRSGIQWVRSIEAYLYFRAGEAWRPLGHRHFAERWYYLEGLRELRRAFYSHPDVQAWFAPAHVTAQHLFKTDITQRERAKAVAEPTKNPGRVMPYSVARSAKAGAA